MINPSLVASGLHHRNATAPVSGALSPLTSVRTVEYKDWQEMILSLMGVCKIVIIDARKTTDAVQFEIDSARKLLDLNQVFFVGKDIESVPPNRCFSEDELLKQLESKFNYISRSIDKTSHCTIYEDRQNGYFRFTPPEGWCFTEYSDPRTKVVFFHPTVPKIVIRFIVRDAPFQDFSSLLLVVRENIPRLEAQLRTSCKIEVTEFLGRETIELTTDQGDGTSITRLFLANGLHFNIQYSAPNGAAFSTFLDEVNHSLESLEPLNQPITSNDEIQRAAQQAIAREVRLAELCADLIDIDEARKTLTEALSKYPDNKQIQDAIRDLNEFSPDKKKEFGKRN